jgi:molybdopterin/thiamine biosynthesis adenylyltransferase
LLSSPKDALETETKDKSKVVQVSQDRSLMKVNFKDIDKNLVEYRHEMLDRHTGILRPEELEVLSKAVICGAGAGGVGGWTYLSLARLGCLHFKIADPSPFNPSNVNRQAGSNFETVGQNKAEVVAGEVQRVSPTAEVEIWPDGVRPETMHSFLEGGSIVIDGVDLYEFDIKKILYDTALKQNIPVISIPILGFGAALAVFHPDKSPGFEEFFGPVPDKSNKEVYDQYIKTFAASIFGFKPKLDWPLYLDRVADGAVPSIGTSALLAAAMATTASVDYLLGRGSIPSVPTTVHIDLMQQKLVRQGSLRRWLLRKYARYSFRHTNSGK